MWKATLHQLVEAFEYKLVMDWDHTSSITAGLYNLMISNSSKPVQPKSALEMHPFRSQTSFITRENFGVLRQIGDAYVGGRRHGS